MLRAIFAVTLGLLLPGISLAQNKLPNIVVIMADDLGYGDVGFNGGPYRTPNLDKLAKSGANLAQHHVYPVCSPTRVALMTGRYASRFGVTNPQNERAMAFDTVTVAEALRSAGYRTGLFGKWHLGSNPDWGPQRFGFDQSYGSLAGGVASYGHVYKKGPFAETWHRNGKLVEEKGHVTDLIAREAVQFVEDPSDKPFFLYVPFTAVHLPIDEPKEWQDKHPEFKDTARSQYAACIAHLDHAVGQIVAALEAKGKMDNTLFIFLSDNGGSIDTENNDPRYAGEHPTFRIPAINRPWRGSKGQVYQGGICSPALIVWRGKVQPGSTIPHPLHVTDWFPTFAKIAGFEAKTDLKWDGLDIGPILTGQQKTPPERVIYTLGTGRNSTALRKGNWVLIEFKNKGLELYDLAKDPQQETNLAPMEPARVAELQRLRQTIAARDDDAKITEK